MNIKHVGLDKLEDLANLNAGIFKSLYAWLPFTLHEYQERLADKQPYILVAEEDGKMIADSIAFERGGYWYLWILGVSSEYRKRGIATRLFEMNETHAKESGYMSVRIKIYDVSKEMLSLTSKRGYTVIETLEPEDSNRKAYNVELKL